MFAFWLGKQPFKQTTCQSSQGKQTFPPTPFFFQHVPFVSLFQMRQLIFFCRFFTFSASYSLLTSTPSQNTFTSLFFSLTLYFNMYKYMCVCVYNIACIIYPLLWKKSILHCPYHFVFLSVFIFPGYFTLETLQVLKAEAAAAAAVSWRRLKLHLAHTHKRIY